VRIIPSICSIATGDLVFFASGKKDYLKFPSMRSGEWSKEELRIADSGNLSE